MQRAILEYTYFKLDHERNIFVTMNCNPKWFEVEQNIYQGWELV